MNEVFHKSNSLQLGLFHFSGNSNTITQIMTVNLYATYAAAYEESPYYRRDDSELIFSRPVLPSTFTAVRRYTPFDSEPFRGAQH